MIQQQPFIVFCEYGFSVSALWCPLATPTILLGFLLPWAWGVSSRLLQQSAAAAPYLGRGAISSPHPSWPSTWDSFSRPSCALAATALGSGVAPPGRRPWPRTWGSSSWLPPFGHGVLPASALDLGHGVAPLRPRLVHRSQPPPCLVCQSQPPQCLQMLGLPWWLRN